MAGLDRPFPPGDYPIVVIGSGPGGMQVAYSLERLGVPHAAISADPSPGGMFRRWLVDEAARPRPARVARVRAL
jgi:cation diffusion facilitator CzcD-associated flavoprotein CzcO